MLGRLAPWCTPDVSRAHEEVRVPWRHRPTQLLHSLAAMHGGRVSTSSLTLRFAWPRWAPAVGGAVPGGFPRRRQLAMLRELVLCVGHPLLTLALG